MKNFLPAKHVDRAHTACLSRSLSSPPPTATGVRVCVRECALWITRQSAVWLRKQQGAPAAVAAATELNDTRQQCDATPVWINETVVAACVCVCVLV